MFCFGLFIYNINNVQIPDVKDNNDELTSLVIQHDIEDICEQLNFLILSDEAMKCTKNKFVKIWMKEDEEKSIESKDDTHNETVRISLIKKQQQQEPKPRPNAFITISNEIIINIVHNHMKELNCDLFRTYNGMIICDFAYQQLPSIYNWTAPKMDEKTGLYHSFCFEEGSEFEVIGGVETEHWIEYGFAIWTKGTWCVRIFIFDVRTRGNVIGVENKKHN